jgi:hypothetical protein
MSDALVTPNAYWLTRLDEAAARDETTVLLPGEVRNLCDLFALALARADASAREAARYREALEFYADKTHWNINGSGHVGEWTGRGTYSVVDDYLARTTLEALATPIAGTPEARDRE